MTKKRFLKIVKSFWKEYGASLIITLIILAIFFGGFVIGRYGKAAPDVVTAESWQTVEPAGDIMPADTPTESTPSADAPAYKEMQVIVTAYCPCAECSAHYGRATATGAVATAGRTIAVDPSVIPYGTEVIINGHTYIAEDCGSAVKGNIIDLFFDTHAEVDAWGKRELTAYICE